MKGRRLAAFLAGLLTLPAAALGVGAAVRYVAVHVDAKIVSGATGRTIRTIRVRLAGVPATRALVPIGDTDGDGKEDFASARPLLSYSRFDARVRGEPPALATLYSGASGAVLRAVAPPAREGVLDSAGIVEAERVGDLDGDGRADVGVVVNRVQRTQAFSSASGRPLFELAGKAVGCGDVNGDGHDDLLLCASPESTRREDGWECAPKGDAYSVRSGADGSELLSLGVQGAGSNGVCTAVRPTGDVDGDGRPDFAVAEDGAAGVTLVSGRSGEPIRTIRATEGDAKSPCRVSAAPVGDLDSDKAADLVVTAVPEGESAATTIALRSGDSGARLFALVAPEGMFVEGGVAWTAGDVDGDGAPDLGLFAYAGSEKDAGHEEPPSAGLLAGFFDVPGPEVLAAYYSGKTGPLLHIVPLGGRRLPRLGPPPLAGDQDGDGVADFIIADASPLQSACGAAWMFSGVARLSLRYAFLAPFTYYAFPGS